MPYGLTVSTELLRVIAGLALFSDCVFVSAQTMRSDETPIPLASGAASELRKYSVPPRSVANWLSGEVAGQTVKPGLPARPTEPIVSIWVTAMVATPDSSWLLEKA